MNHDTLQQMFIAKNDASNKFLDDLHAEAVRIAEKFSKAIDAEQRWQHKDGSDHPLVWLVSSVPDLADDGLDAGKPVRLRARDAQVDGSGVMHFAVAVSFRWEGVRSALRIFAKIKSPIVGRFDYSLSAVPGLSVVQDIWTTDSNEFVTMLTEELKAFLNHHPRHGFRIETSVA